MTRLFLVAAAILAGCSTNPTGRKPAAASEPPMSQAELDEVTQGIGDLFERVLKNFHPGTGPGVDRPVFTKTHGCAKGTITIPGDLPPVFKQGLFAQPQTKQVWIRFSSDTVKTTFDNEKKTIGFALKVLDVPGPKVLEGEENSTSQDFLLQNYHVFFVDNARDFLHLFDGKHPEFRSQHPRTVEILDLMDQDVANVLDIPYWSTLPYALGDSNFVKYKVEPCTVGLKTEPITGKQNFLRQRLERDMIAKRKTPVCFNLRMQLRTGEHMPLEQATVEWSEKESPPQTVATIQFDRQDIRKNTKACEEMSFTAWHSLEAHKPVGSISYARGKVYKRLADIRRKRNKLPLVEPQSTSGQGR